VYDKRAVNGAAFVYHGMLPVPLDSEEAKVLIPYTRGVLDAMKIKHGATHGEVMMTEDGPCLVEMNCRAHGGDGNWICLARALTGGYSQVDAGVDAFLDEPSFKSLPNVPASPFQAGGQEVMLVSFTEGIVKATPGYEAIKALQSFASLETSVQPGVKVEFTTDLFTNVGSVIVLHSDPAQVAKDVETIRQMERDCALFELEARAEILSRPRAESGDKPSYDKLVSDSSEKKWCSVM